MPSRCSGSWADTVSWLTTYPCGGILCSHEEIRTLCAALDEPMCYLKRTGRLRRACKAQPLCMSLFKMERCRESDRNNFGCRLLAIRAVADSNRKDQEVKAHVGSFYCTFGKCLNCLNTYNMYTYYFIGIHMYSRSSVPTGFTSTKPGLKMFREKEPVWKMFYLFSCYYSLNSTIKQLSP